MNTKKIYLTRHGQTDFNKQGIVQGSGVDSDLNTQGRAQARAFYDHYKDLPFDKLYVSALRRTHQSMQSFIDAGIDYEVLPELNEISWGVREGIPVDAEGDAYYKDMIKSWQEGRTDVRIEGGENPKEVAERMKVALAHILAQPGEENVLICMHGRAMRVMLTVMLNYPLNGMDFFDHSNLCLYELTWSGSMFSVNKYNDTTHLIQAGL